MPGIGDWIKSGASGLLDGVFKGASDIIRDFKADPNKVLEHEAKLAELRSNTETKLVELANQADEIAAKELETVNATIREEAKSEHWMVWSWRPSIGFTFCGIIFYNYIVAPACHLTKVDIPSEVWTAMLVILGAASAGRSFEKIKK